MKLAIRSNGEPGVKNLQRKFTKLAFDIKNRRPLFSRIGVLLLNAVAENFQQQGHEGTPWQALSPRTVAGRRKGPGTGSARILEDTGELRRSFTMEATNESLRVGTAKIYAPPHEYGYKQIPQRKMLPSKKYGLQVAVDMADKYLKEQIQKVKLG